MAVNSRKPTVETLEQDVVALKTDLSRIADTLSSLAEHSAEAGLNSVRSKAAGAAGGARSFLAGADTEVRTAIDHLRTAGRDAVRETRVRVANGRGDLETAIERNPLAALGLAVAAGFAVGMIANGRRDRD